MVCGEWGGEGLYCEWVLSGFGGGSVFGNFSGGRADFGRLTEWRIAGLRSFGAVVLMLTNLVET